MSQEVGQTELKAKTQQLLDGPLKHIRAAAIAAALLPLASVAATPASAEGVVCNSGGVCGVVFTDVNKNGIQDAGDTPIENAKVTVCQLCDGTDDITVDTGPTGAYLIIVPELPSGQTYTVSVLIPTGTQLTSPNVGLDDTIDSDGLPNGAFSTATGAKGDGTATDFGFVTSSFLNPGTGTPGYWKNHPDAWPAGATPIVIGSNSYTRDQAILWLGKVGKDKTTTIFASYVSAYLNTFIGNDPGCVSSAMKAAKAWLATYPVGSNVSGSSAEWQQIEWAHQTMDAYNNGLLCAPHRQ
jgi:SdrD B-like domain